MKKNLISLLYLSVSDEIFSMYRHYYYSKKGKSEKGYILMNKITTHLDSVSSKIGYL